MGLSPWSRAPLHAPLTVREETCAWPASSLVAYQSAMRAVERQKCPCGALPSPALARARARFLLMCGLTVAVRGGL